MKHIIQQLIIEMATSVDENDWRTASNINKAVHKLLMNMKQQEEVEEE